MNADADAIANARRFFARRRRVARRRCVVDGLAGRVVVIHTFAIASTRDTDRATRCDDVRVLVTGGAGYIGTHTCVQLLLAGASVVAIDNFDNSCAEAVERVRAIVGDGAPRG